MYHWEGGSEGGKYAHGHYLEDNISTYVYNLNFCSTIYCIPVGVRKCYIHYYSRIHVHDCDSCVTCTEYDSDDTLIISVNLGLETRSWVALYLGMPGPKDRRGWDVLCRTSWYSRMVHTSYLYNRMSWPVDGLSWPLPGYLKYTKTLNVHSVCV